MKKIRTLLKAPVLVQSGYSVHSRQIFRALFSNPMFDLHVENIKWGSCPFLTEDTEEKRAIKECVKKFAIAKHQKQENWDLYITITIPNEFEQKGKINVGVTAGAEVDRISHQWVQKCNEMDLIIVPSEFVKDVFEKTVVEWKNEKTGQTGQFKLEKPVVVCNEGVDTSIFYPWTEEEKDKLVQHPDNHPGYLDLDLKPDFNFLSIAQWGKGSFGEDRKNIANLVKWFIETFAKRKDVGLVLKVNMARNNITDYNIVKNRLEQIKNNFNSEDVPPIYLIHGNLTNKEMSSLYNHPKIKSFVSFTHGEGFGLPLLEAAACGLPVIATNWSGHLDFLTRKKFSAVDYELKEIPEIAVWDPILIKGSQWACAKEEDAKHRMKKMVKNYSTPKDWAKELSERIREEFDINVVCENFVDTLKVCFSAPKNQSEAAKSTNPTEYLQQVVDTPEDYNILYTMPQSNGDVFISTAVIDGLMKDVRKVQPNAKLYFATAPQFAAILDENPNVHKVIDWQDFMISVDITEAAFDLVLTPNVATQYTFSNWVRRGQGRRLAEEFANHCQTELGEYFVKEEQLESGMPDCDYVTFHPGSGKDKWESRRYVDWPEVLVNIKKQFPGVKIAQVGSADEPEFDVDFDYRGKTNVHQLAALIKDSKMHLSIDTLTMHMAAAYETPVLALFGCSYANSTGPWVSNEEGAKIILLESERRTCGCTKACYKDKPVSKHRYAPINEIDPKTVVKAAEALLIDQFEKEDVEYERITAKISGYTTAYNCINLRIPFKESIKSFLSFCDEVVIVDGESTDGTYEILQELAESDDRIKLYQHLFDWQEPGIDGLQKAYARVFCNPEHEFLLQFDLDELAHEKDDEKWKLLTKRFPKEVDVLHLPVVELWADLEHATTRRHSWKWRLSRNKPEITHGINKHARLTNEETGKVYAKEGVSDGCEYVNVMNYEMVPHTGFYMQNRQIEAARMGSPDDYANIMNQVFDVLPSVWHTSWLNIPNKIKQLQPDGTWDKLWSLLYQKKNQNRFGDTDFSIQEQVDVLTKRLEDLGGEESDQIKGKFKLKHEAPLLLKQYYEKPTT